VGGLDSRRIGLAGSDKSFDLFTEPARPRRRIRTPALDHAEQNRNKRACPTVFSFVNVWTPPRIKPSRDQARDGSSRRTHERISRISEVTDYVATSHSSSSDDGVAPAGAVECLDPNAAVMRAEALSKRDENDSPDVDFKLNALAYSIEGRCGNVIAARPARIPAFRLLGLRFAAGNGSTISRSLSKSV